MQVFKCDICGKDTKIYPKTAQKYKDEFREVESYDKKEKKIVTKHQLVKVPVVELMDWQNPSNGSIQKREIPIVEDLEERAILVRLSIGPFDSVQRDFCTDCYSKIKPDCDKLMKQLKSIVPQ